MSSRSNDKTNKATNVVFRLEQYLDARDKYFMERLTIVQGFAYLDFPGTEGREETQRRRIDAERAADNLYVALRAVTGD